MDVLKNLLNQFTKTEQRIYWLREVGYSYEEIARSFAMSEKMVDNTIQKIRRNIKKTFGND